MESPSSVQAVEWTGLSIIAKEVAVLFYRSFGLFTRKEFGNASKCQGLAGPTGWALGGLLSSGWDRSSPCMCKVSLICLDTYLRWVLG